MNHLAVNDLEIQYALILIPLMAHGVWSICAWIIMITQIERELELQQTKEMLARLGKKADNVEKLDKSGREVRVKARRLCCVVLCCVVWHTFVPGLVRFRGRSVCSVLTHFFNSCDVWERMFLVWHGHLVPPMIMIGRYPWLIYRRGNLRLHNLIILSADPSS